MFQPEEVEAFKKRTRARKKSTKRANAKRAEAFAKLGPNFFKDRAARGGMVRFLKYGSEGMREMAKKSHKKRRENRDG